MKKKEKKEEIKANSSNYEINIITKKRVKTTIKIEKPYFIIVFKEEPNILPISITSNDYNIYLIYCFTTYERMIKKSKELSKLHIIRIGKNENNNIIYYSL